MKKQRMSKEFVESAFRLLRLPDRDLQNYPTPHKKKCDWDQVELFLYCLEEERKMIDRLIEDLSLAVLNKEQK